MCGPPYFQKSPFSQIHDMIMNFYATNEETPLLRSIQMATSPARSESETNSPSLASSGSSSMYSQSNRLHNQTEVQLSVDKVSFIYSPKSPNSSSFHAASSEYNDDELSILDPYFDVTSARLIMAFEEGHPNGRISFLSSFTNSSID